MQKIAVEHAKQRLAKARDAMADFEKASSLDVAKSAWSDFLIAASGVYSKLEQGAKGNGKSEGWYGKVKSKRRKDPLLSYIHHARNADEHGLGEIAKKVPGHWSLKLERGSAVRLSGGLHLGSDSSKTDLKIKTVKGKPPTIEVRQPSLALVSVVDSRFGDTFAPPSRHLGTAIEPKPDEVARLALAYLEGLISQADSLVV